MELREFLAWLTSGVGAGIAAFFLMEKVSYFRNLPPEPKRYAAIALNALIACGAWSLGVAVGYQAAPIGGLAWVEQLFLVGTTAFGLSQVIHARAALS